MHQVRRRTMDDMAIGIPTLLPLPLDRELLGHVADQASVTRGEGLRFIRRELEKDRNTALRSFVLLLKLMVFKQVEEVVDRVAREGATVACAAGCTACCHQDVETSIPEAILVALHVADPADPRHRKILETADATAGLSWSDRVRSGHPCPLLVDDRCSIYEDRPLMCRATLAANAKPCIDTLYAETHGGTGGGLEVYPIPQFFAFGEIAALRGISKDLGLQYDNVSLVMTVAAILRDPSLPDRWVAGETVFKPVPPKPTAPMA